MLQTTRFVRTLLAGAVLCGVSASGYGLAVAGPADRPSEEEIGQVQIYLTADQAVREIFENVVMVDTVSAALTPEEQVRVREKLGGNAVADTMSILRALDRTGNLLGLAVIGNEVGKYRPITFMVGVSPELKVVGVEILIYRESRGGEVRRTRFLRQYRGKDPDDAIRTNRDILNIAGATLSVNALNHGVKKALAVLDLLAARKAL